MLKTDMIKKLNEQMNLESFSSNLYLQMSAWCSAHAFNGAAAFLRTHANEEYGHMLRLLDYLDGTGCMPLITSIDKPGSEYDSLYTLFEKTYEHEKMITDSINRLVDMAFTSKDYSTFNFLQWYVAEQHEEEKLFKSIVDKLRLVGSSGEALYIIDKDIGNLSIKK